MLLDVAEFVLAGVRKHEASLRGSKRHEPPARVPKDVLAKERKSSGVVLLWSMYNRFRSFPGSGLPFAVAASGLFVCQPLPGSIYEQIQTSQKNTDTEGTYH